MKAGGPYSCCNSFKWLELLTLEVSPDEVPITQRGAARVKFSMERPRSILFFRPDEEQDGTGKGDVSR